MKKSAVIAHIRQLCSLGLGGQVIMPELTNALHELIVSRLNCFFYADGNGQIVNIFVEPLCIKDEFLSLPGFCAYRKLDYPSYLPLNGMKLDSALSNLNSPVWQFFNHGSVLNTPIQDPETGLLGAMQLFRCHNEPPFSPQDQSLMKSLIPYFALGIKGNRNKRPPCINSGTSGLIIANKTAKVLYTSPSGQELLYLATNPIIRSISLEIGRPPTPSCLDNTDLPTAIRNLCKNLVANLLDKTVLPITCFQKNGWGKFLFRAHWLVPIEPKEETLIGITIERHIPQPLKLVESMWRLSLSPRQKEICLLLTYGYSYNDVAKRLALSPHTASDYIKAIYITLEVHSRNELLEKLKALDGIDFSEARIHRVNKKCTNSSCPYSH